MTTQCCTQCGAIKPYSDYYAHPDTKTGYNRRCKACMLAYAKQHRKDNNAIYKTRDRARDATDTRLEWHKDYRKSPEGIASSKRTNEKTELNYPNQCSAQQEVKSALNNKTITRPDACSSCKELVDHTLHGHHDDYNKPLDVRWLCCKCHSLWHREHGEGANR